MMPDWDPDPLDDDEWLEPWFNEPITLIDEEAEKEAEEKDE